MTETIIDQRGRVFIPDEIMREPVRVKKQDEGIATKPVRKAKRSWKQLCGITPKRTGKPEWPTPREIKNIWP